MDARGIDALVMQNSNDHLGGYVRWFTDIPATNGSPRTVIFSRDGSMTLIEQGPRHAEQNIKFGDPVFRGISRRMFSPSYCSVHYTRHYDAECTIREIRRREYRVIGLVATAAMYFDFCQQLKDGLASTIEFVDATDFVDDVKVIKSPEEINCIRKTAKMQDEVFRRVLKQVRPGMRDFEVTALAQYVGHCLESEQGTFNGVSAPIGEPSSLQLHRHEQGRVIQQGDHFNLLIENNGPGGFYTEIARTLVFGRATNELQDAFERCKEAQQATLSQLRPGAACSDIFAAHNAFMHSQGLPEEKRLFAHGQGYDLVERPLIRDDETMMVRGGMNFAIHPGFSTDRLFMTVCDNFIVSGSGQGERLHSTPQQIFEIC
jgi:Xaa-Pro aminopeptidase